MATKVAFDTIKPWEEAKADGVLAHEHYELVKRMGAQILPDALFESCLMAEILDDIKLNMPRSDDVRSPLTLRFRRQSERRAG